MITSRTISHRLQDLVGEKWKIVRGGGKGLTFINKNTSKDKQVPPPQMGINKDSSSATRKLETDEECKEAKSKIRPRASRQL